MFNLLFPCSIIGIDMEFMAISIWRFIQQKKLAVGINTDCNRPTSFMSLTGIRPKILIISWLQNEGSRHWLIEVIQVEMSSGFFP